MKRQKRGRNRVLFLNASSLISRCRTSIISGLDDVGAVCVYPLKLLIPLSCLETIATSLSLLSFHRDAE